jgi:hypothetical protein
MMHLQMHIPPHISSLLCVALHSTEVFERVSVFLDVAINTA